MWKFKKSGPRCFCRLLVALLTLATVRGAEIKDFIAVNTLPDGEVETRIYYRDISAKEVTVARGSSSDIKFRQLATRRHLIQLIYSDGEDLKDCEIVHQIDQVKKFLYNFKSDLRNLIATSNVTVESLDDKTLPSGIATWFNYTQLKQSCRQLHRDMKKEIREKQKEKNRTAWTWRQKRSIFILPGTLWCGKSHNARHYTELGAMSKTDKCCRKHDHCKRNIQAFSTKFHLHNLSPFTISHCHCDASFRACLKMVDSSDANLVGKLFFNVVQSKCFVIKPKKVCMKSSWWGQCEKYRHEKRAILRDNLPY